MLNNCETCGYFYKEKGLPWMCSYWSERRNEYGSCGFWKFDSRLNNRPLKGDWSLTIPKDNYKKNYKKDKYEKDNYEN